MLLRPLDIVQRISPGGCVSMMARAGSRSPLLMGRRIHPRPGRESCSRHPARPLSQSACNVRSRTGRTSLARVSLVRPVSRFVCRWDSGTVAGGHCLCGLTSSYTFSPCTDRTPCHPQLVHDGHLQPAFNGHDGVLNDPVVRLRISRSRPGVESRPAYAVRAAPQPSPGCCGCCCSTMRAYSTEYRAHG